MKRLLPFILALVVILSAAMALAQTTRPASGGAERIVAYHTIGHSSPDAADRRVGWNLKAEGWAGYVEQNVKPQITWGCQRFYLSNPFGALEPELMQFDQYLHAKAGIEGVHPPLPWLTEGFVEAWKPITDQGVEVICYLGSMQGDPDFDDATPAGKLDRFNRSIQPALQAGMAIGFDASVLYPDGSFYARAVELVKSTGVRVYVEARPGKVNVWTHDENVICINSTWLKDDPALVPNTWAVPTDQLTGEIVRIVDDRGTSWARHDWQLPQTRQILRDGHTAAAPVGFFIEHGITREDLDN